MELKVPFALTPDRRASLLALKATFVGLLNQVDTYFAVPTGRLKLRETAGRPAELIAYARPDLDGLRRSDYVTTPITDPAGLTAALSATLGVRVVVRKRRELLQWQNVRIHLDTVEGLGEFLEFEAELADVDETESAARLRQLMTTLGIHSADAIGGSYSDLLMNRTA